MELLNPRLNLVSVSQPFSTQTAFSAKRYSRRIPLFYNFLFAFELGARQHAGQFERFVMFRAARTEGPVSLAISSNRGKTLELSSVWPDSTSGRRDERSSVSF